MDIGDIIKGWQATLVTDDTGALTMQDIVAQTGLAQTTIVRRVQVAIRQGLMEVCFVRRNRIDGLAYTSPAYRVKGARGKGKDKK